MAKIDRAVAMTSAEAEQLQEAIRALAEHPARQARLRFAAMLGCQHDIDIKDGEERCAKCRAPSWAILAAKTKAEADG